MCGSHSRLIIGCDFHEKRMAKEDELKKQRMGNTGNMMAKPIWNNANRINHANKFIPRPLLINAGRSQVNSVQSNFKSGRQNYNSAKPNVNFGYANDKSVQTRQQKPTSTYYKKPQVNTYSQKSNSVKSHSPVRISIPQVITVNQIYNFANLH